MNAHVFAYGTLLYPDVMEAVTGAQFASEEALLKGFARYQLRGRVYPGVVEAPGSATGGRLYRDVGALALELLDRFEGSLYERRAVQVTRADGTRVEAQAYVVPARHRFHLAPQPWDPARFEREHLTPYVAACRAFQRENAAAARAAVARRS